LDFIFENHLNEHLQFRRKETSAIVITFSVAPLVGVGMFFYKYSTPTESLSGINAEIMDTQQLNFNIDIND